MSKIINLTNKDINQIIHLYCDKKFTLKNIRDLFKDKIKDPQFIKKVLIRNNIEIRKYTITRASKHNIDINYFKTIDTEDKAYWMGYLAADGCIYKNGHKVTLISKDIDIIKKFKESIKSEHKITNNITFDKRTNKTYKSHTIQITSTEFANNLINSGIKYDKSNNLIFPNIREDLYRHFIRGLFDGDGSIITTKYNAPIRINLISTLEVLNFLQNYLKTKFGIEKKNISKVTENKLNVYKMHLYKDADKFLEWIYNNSRISLDRKYKQFLEYKNYIEVSDKPNSKKRVLQLDMNNNPIKEWDSISEAMKDFQKILHITSVCKNKRQSAGGYKWRYIKDNEIINLK